MATVAPRYPVDVEGRLDPQLSRWLWLVKWLLAIPHFVVLAFLWVAFFVLSVVAFFAILFTRRYPRGLFDFNVGVLRWSWRVSFYSYGTLGTDRYPPFTLADVEDYPARLEINYPDRLNRWLPFVKWLLAIPHLLLVGIFIGGSGFFAWESTHWVWRTGGPGLIRLLVFIAAVILLFTGKYPRSIFDFVLGLNRWALRVAAYVGLMTDRYPPFRLDSGGSEHPSGGQMALDLPGPEPSPAAPTAPAMPQARRRWTAGRIAMLVIGSLLALIGLGFAAGGGFGLWLHTTQRDSDGYLMTNTHQFATPSYAMATRSLHISSEVPSFLYGQSWLGTVRVRGESLNPSRPLFIGIARRSDVQAYLARVAHADVIDVQEHPFKASYRPQPGGAPAVPPERARFWVASVSGPGKQVLSWHVKSGSWSVVVMRPGGTRGVAADMAVGAKAPALLGVSLGLLGLGLIFLAGGAALIYFGGREPRKELQP
ncbi:MAG TPA: DUF4389 domain-containing protein [Thermoleophilaceae bacterium]